MELFSLTEYCRRLLALFLEWPLRLHIMFITYVTNLVYWKLKLGNTKSNGLPSWYVISTTDVAG